MKRKGLIIGIAAGLLLIVSFRDAKAEQSHYKGKFAGTFLGTRIELNDDGVPASWATVEVSGTLGKRTNQSISETVPTGQTPECPGGVFIIDVQHGIGFGTGTGTFPNGDQIYFQVLTRTQCGLGGGQFTGSDTVSIVGGTGKFDGASGTYEQHFTSFCQACDLNATPPQTFGSVSGEFDGTLILP
jgi:hypothetical protein